MVYMREDVPAITHEAAVTIARWLETRADTVSVQNVVDDPEYRARHIDIVWTRRLDDGTHANASIRIRAERYGHTGEYHLEAPVGTEGATPEAMVATEADYIYYYFLPRSELHILPMQQVRGWLREHAAEMRQLRPPTVLDSAEGVEVGRLVSRDRLLREVGGIRVVQLRPRAA